MSSLDHQPTLPTPVLDLSATPLDDLETVLRDGADDGAVQHADALKCLDEIRSQMREARNIWQRYADNPVQPDDQLTAVMWIGPQRSRELHRIRLSLRDLARSLTEASGVRFHDTIGFSPQVDIVDAYAQLQPDETAAERASEAIATIDERLAGVEALLAKLN